ncbi:TonB-dependent siderophore receptor [Agarivorans aestuarii]|uniref:TonB-dependent siderophore receptor n=1 Tax=Agarivorans aestuarii TaxID=1563703 RepID=A0ABU7G0Q2_9ALTE|nr:TonB-dependent siderophore receptor [Agarivorans aestuarii]MEE1672996.1 TonB-dependent siderophore receptor [Agarivorans aestuarii]
MFNTKVTTIAALVASLMSAPALAQEATPTENQADEKLTVLGKTYRNTATKTSLLPEETPQSISTIDRETLDLRGVNSVAEALRYVPGVHTQLRGGAVSRLDLYNIRGFTNYQNYYDGLQLQYNAWNLQPQIDAIAVEQVEVFKGPTSVLYGAMPPGGMVNMIAKRPTMERATDVSIASGSHNLAEATIDSRGQIGDSNVAYRFIGKASKKDGMADTSKEERYVIAPSIDWHVSDKTLVNLNAYYQNDPHAGIYTTMPAYGTVLDNPNGKLSKNLFTGDQNWNKFEREFGLYGIKINHEFSNNWTLLHATRYLDGKALQHNTYNVGLEADGRTLYRRAYLTDEKSQGWTTDTQLAGIFDTGVVEHNLLIGFDWQQLDSQVTYYDGMTAPIDIYNPDNNQLNPNEVYDYIKGNPDGYNQRNSYKTTQTGLYLQDQMRIDRLIVMAGARLDSYKSDSTFHLSNSSAVVDQNNTSFRIGGLYEFDNGISPYINYADSFEPVPGADKDGNVFEPSKGKQWEGGVKYNSADMSQMLNLAAFHITKEGALTKDPNGSLPHHQIQVGEQVSQGIEAEGRWWVSHNLDISASYTYQDVEITKDNSGLEGKTPVWVPDQLANIWANYHFYNGNLDGLTLGGGVRYIGETQIDAANSSTVAGYTVADVSLNYGLGRFGSGMENSAVSLAVTNLFDEESYTCYDTLNCWANDERRVVARIKMGF